MSLDHPEIVIATLALDEASFDWLDDLRQRHFPRERNYLRAHLTLFHHLSPDQADAMRDVARTQPPIALTFSGLRSLGRGVAYEVTSDALLRFRKTLMGAAGGAFTAQDRQGFKPHITVQNKVAPNDARALLNDLRSTFMPREGLGTGLALWTYGGGPWELREVAEFRN